MGQPTPPGDSPLYEGLDSSWNDVINAVPEDRRSEFAPLLKSKIDAYGSQYEPLKQYEEFHKSGIGSEQLSTALNIFSLVENDPRKVYDAIGNHLGLTQQEQDDLQEAIEDGDTDDPRIQRLQQQVETMAQIMLSQNQSEVAQKQAAEADAMIEKELSGLKKKYGDVDEEEVIMRMLHRNMSAEDAYKDYTGKFDQIRARRPAPMLLGSTGSVPSRAIDPRKLDTSQTKNLVVQMLQNAQNEANR